MKKTFMVLVLCVGLGQLASAQQKLTYVDLIKGLTDLERLAVLPEPGEKCAQWSSYDRRSRYDEATGKYVEWSANGDGGGVIRKEGEQLVFAEMEGPGCIWRIWSARPQAGHVRVFLDGAAEPAIDLPFSSYFDGKTEPFTRPALVHVTATGWNNYTPIPYQKSCKIVADPGWGNYFHFTYTTYPKGTIVPTFKLELSAEEKAALDEANRILSNCGSDPAGKRAGEATESKTVALPAGGAVRVADLTGPRAITSLRLKLDLPPSPDDRNVLRELTLQIRWDGEVEPSVWSPLGDFFGTAAGANKYRSLPLGLTDDGQWYCYWYMPFGKSASVELGNDGQAERTVAIEITHAPLAQPLEKLARFHAKWHRDAFLPPEPERQIDWTMVKAEGAGRFCGVMLHVWNPKGGWWGEGDEKFHVDGEKFPSTIGTGSEDYFGYAWGNATLFQNCYHNQTISMGNKGHVSVNRWHITDNVPFQTSFEGYIEKYFPNNRPTLYAGIAYWYLSPGGKDEYKPVPLEERVGYWVEPEVAGVKGALEGEQLKILGCTGGNAREQELSGFGAGWSRDAHLWWTGAKPGDKLDLAIPVQTAGRYKIVLHMTKARDYGIVQLYLDDQKLGDPIDLYNDGVIPTGVMDMGVRELTAGEHKLTAEIVGANDKAVKAYMFGLDYVKLEPGQ